MNTAFKSQLSESCPTSPCATSLFGKSSSRGRTDSMSTTPRPLIGTIYPSFQLGRAAAISYFSSNDLGPISHAGGKIDTSPTLSLICRLYRTQCPVRVKFAKTPRGNWQLIEWVEEHRHVGQPLYGSERDKRLYTLSKEEKKEMRERKEGLEEKVKRSNLSHSWALASSSSELAAPSSSKHEVSLLTLEQIVANSAKLKTEYQLALKRVEVGERVKEQESMERAFKELRKQEEINLALEKLREQEEIAEKLRAAKEQEQGREWAERE